MALLGDDPVDTPDLKDMSNKYNTKLTPQEEKQFQTWASQNNRQNDAYDYDIRGAWKETISGSMSEDARGHLGDKYKKPNHPTFSDQSTYNGVDGNKGGTWKELEGGKYAFVPSAHNLKNMPPEELQKYFDQVEQGTAVLELPISSRMYPKMKGNK